MVKLIEPKLPSSPKAAVKDAAGGTAAVAWTALIVISGVAAAQAAFHHGKRLASESSGAAMSLLGKAA